MKKQTQAAALVGAAALAFLAENKRSNEELTTERYVVSSKKFREHFIKRRLFS